MPRPLVQISIGIDPDLLDRIIKDVKGDSQAEKLRLCITEGYKILSR